jgi:rubrerythrin
MFSHEYIKSLDDLLYVAGAMHQEYANRYRELVAQLREQDDAGVVAELEALAALEDRQAREAGARSRSAHLGPASQKPVDRPLPSFLDEEEVRQAVASAYQALAFAVRSEERAFAFYTYVAAAADNQAVRMLAEDLARDELSRAARLRRLRRRAFHRDRPVRAEIPTSVERLRSLVREWEKGAATAHAGLADRLERAGRHKEAEIFRGLASEEEAASDDAPVVESSSLASVDEGLRVLEANFDRLALIGERAKDERVVAEALRLTEGMVARLALVSDTLRANPANAT